MVDSFKQILPLSNHIDIGVGYFFLSGFEVIEDNITEYMNRGGSIRILMGNITTIKTGETIHEGYEQKAQTKELLFEELSKANQKDESLTLIKKIHQWISEQRLEVKIYTGDANYFHAKSYLFYRQDKNQTYDGVSIVGSSNFTKSGFIGNTELNSVSQDNFGPLSIWFQDIWNSEEVMDFSMELLDFIDSQVIKSDVELEKIIYMHPKETYSTFAKYFVRKLPEQISGEFMDNLYKHQKVGVSECKYRLDRYNTCVLADGVGLGKTRTAAATILASHSKPVLILASRKLHEQWRNELNAVGVREDRYLLKSKEEVARKELASLDEYLDTELIIVDEAHQGLKNSRTKLYRNLYFIKERSPQKVKGLLLTATPWNNSRSDVFNLGRLFLSVKNIHAETPYYPYLFHGRRKAEKAIQEDDKAFKTFWRDLFLQRTKRTYGGQDVIYSERNFPVIEVKYEPQKEKAFSANGERIDRLHLPYMNPLRYIRNEEQEEFTANRMKVLFLKRADSSWAAFKDTLEKVLYHNSKLLNDLNNIYQKSDNVAQFKEWLRAFYELDIKDQYGELFEGIDEEEINEMFKLEEISFQRKEKNRIRLDTKIQSISHNKAVQTMKAMIKHAEDDLTILKTIIDELDTAFRRKDEKYEKIRDSILSYLKKGEKVLLISQFRSTVINYYKRFVNDEKFKKYNLAQVTGSDDECYINHDLINSKDEVLERFSPQSKNRTDIVHSNREVQLVIGTETLSVGQNLQDCNVLMNIDLPYNPMNLEQRIGRIDRPREEVGTGIIDIITFPSMPVIESELKLTQRLRQKLHGIYEDTKFDNLVLPEYQDFLNQVLDKRAVGGKDMETMVDKTIQSTVLTIDAEEHSVAYIESQKRMKQELDKEYEINHEAEIRDCSFSKNSGHTAVVKITLKDVNSNIIDEYNKHIMIYNNDIKEELTEVEPLWYKAYDSSILNQKELSLDEAQNKLIEVKNEIVNSFLKKEINQYNQRIKIEDELDSQMVDKKVKKVIVDIKENTRGQNKNLIASKIKQAGFEPKSIKVLINHIQYIDRQIDVQDMELINELYENIGKLWDSYSYYYSQLVKEEQMELDHDFSGAVRMADEQQSEVQWIIGNIGINF